MAVLGPCIDTMEVYIGSENYFGRMLLHETNYSHYHRYSWVVPCNGIECHVPVAVIVIACLAAVMVLYLIGFFLYKRWKFQKALRSGQVPATMLVAGRWTMSSSQEEPHKFTFLIQKIQMDDDLAIDECPICLKTKEELRECIVFTKCKHGTCESCFRRMVSRQRLHTACPLCREYLSFSEEEEADRGAKELLPQSQTILPNRSASRERERDEERQERRRRRRERRREEAAQEETLPGDNVDSTPDDDVEQGNRESHVN